MHKQNINTSVIPYLENDNWYYPQADIYHILHATRFLQWSRENGFTLDRPYLVTMGGTDINIDLQEDMEEEMFAFLDHAKFITVFTEDAKEKVNHLAPEWGEKTIVITQGIWMPWNISKRSQEMIPRILLPAGLRPVKDVLHVLPALDRLKEDYTDMDFTILGANLDGNVHAEIQKAAMSRNWMKYAGVVPYEVMKIWYETAQIVINTSQSEGQSIALMEAMAMGRPVIARNNEANRALISHGRTGWIYETMPEFAEAVHSIVNDRFMREMVVQQARDWIIEHCSPEEEAIAYHQLYRKI
ncbi:glycosyltransferase [Peribacillus glennii]|uniref:glycosyltransferase n=1 Tax=Peribacillus glennii TaxID=2303991 RepID=UPI001314A7F3|nr:glycosyltransferase [Peribacillus glennii]